MARLLVLLASLCFSTTGTAVALGAAGASSVSVGAARLAVGAIGLQTAWFVLARPGIGRRRLPLPDSRTLWLGALGVAAYQMSFFLAVRATGVAVGTVVALGTAPVATGVLGLLTGAARPDRRWAAATALAVAGLIILVIDGDGSTVHPAGAFPALLAGISYAAYTTAAKVELDSGGDSTGTTTKLFTGGALLLTPAFVLLPADWLATAPGALTTLWLGLVTVTLAYLLFTRGLCALSAAEVSTLTLVEPVCATALGVALLGERVGPRQLAGAGALLAGLAVLAAPTRTTRTTRTVLEASR